MQCYNDESLSTENWGSLFSVTIVAWSLLSIAWNSWNHQVLALGRSSSSEGEKREALRFIIHSHGQRLHLSTATYYYYVISTQLRSVVTTSVFPNCEASQLERSMPKGWTTTAAKYDSICKALLQCSKCVLFIREAQKFYTRWSNASAGVLNWLTSFVVAKKNATIGNAKPKVIGVYFCWRIPKMKLLQGMWEMAERDRKNVLISFFVWQKWIWLYV